MEQELVNSLLKLLSVAGGSSLVSGLIAETDTDGNPVSWNTSETEKAIDYINLQADNFGTAEAVAIIESLLTKYNLRAESFMQHEDPAALNDGVPGLQ